MIALELELTLLLFPSPEEHYSPIYTTIYSMFSHEKLQVYQRAIQWLVVSAELVETFPSGCSGSSSAQ